MKIYTSYYGRTKKLIKNNILPISISLFKPKYLKDDIKNELKYLAPRYNILKMEVPEYVPNYTNILKRFSAKKVIEEIKQITKGKDCALMCYERPEDFCHRHMVSEWLSKNTEFEVIEWSGEEKESSQVDLF